MDKGRLHHIWTRLRAVRPWYFLVVFVLSMAVCVWSLRENNLHMIHLRDAVYQADKDDANVELALKKLQTYVYAHMNTALASGPDAVHPPIQLKYTYDRLVNAESKKVAAANAKIYTNAQAYCEAQIPTGFSGRYRIACIDSYVTSHGAKVQAIPKNLYEFDFTSPKWSPDLAGWSLVLSILSLLLFVCFWFVDWYIRRTLKQHA